MIASSANSPAPAASPLTCVAAMPRRPRRKNSAQKCEREALAELLSVIRNVRYDIDRSKAGRIAPVSPEYLVSVGLQILEVADEYRSITPHDWDLIIDRASALVSGE